MASYQLITKHDQSQLLKFIFNVQFMYIFVLAMECGANSHYSTCITQRPCAEVERNLSSIAGCVEGKNDVVITSYFNGVEAKRTTQLY